MPTRAQQNKFHAMIGEIASQAQHLGSYWDQDDFKRFLVYRFAFETKEIPEPRMVTGLGGQGIVQLGIQTANFSESTASKFIEWLYAWGIENGIRWSAAYE